MSELAQETLKSDHRIEAIDDLLEMVRAYNPQADLDAIKKAYEFSEKAHSGQIRRSGEPYIFHPLGVAAILAELKLDVPSVITGLLHDTVEDTAVTLEDVEKEFGEVVARLVDGVTKISRIRFRNTHEKQGENIRKMIVAMGKDVRVVLVKLADRLHNMRTLNHMPPSKQAAIAQETLDIYAPLASRLGMNSLKVELEDLSFRFSRPEAYYGLAQKIASKKREREKYIEDVKRILTQEVSKRTKIQFEVQGRPKHFYSIYRKMTSRGIDYEQVFDLLAFRVCVGTVSECYEILGIVHSLWKPIPGRFKDFIAMPKANNYQSLHTTVVGPDGERIEIQIRTFEMHAVAERGIAAHWSYKESSDDDGAPLDQNSANKFNWLRELVAMHQQTHSADEFLENIKVDLFESEIYVFTPRGDVKELPEGATPIDFAYSVHTDVGNHIVAARVNGRMVNLKQTLQNGDTVEVITSKTQWPSKDWLNSCVTTRAKSKIRAHVKQEQRQRALDMGKDLLEKYGRKNGTSLPRLLQGATYEKYLKDHGLSSSDDLFIKLGYGTITPAEVLDQLMPGSKKVADQEPSFLQRAFKAAALRTKRSGTLIRVDGMEDVLVRFAKCCTPIPGDAIVGYITLGRGIMIHRADCAKAYALDQARRVDVEWSNDKPMEVSRMVRIRVLSQDVPGMLKNMSEVFTTFGVNIHNAQARTTRDLKAVCTFDVSVRDTAQLNQVITGLSKLKGVIGVTRMTHN